MATGGVRARAEKNRSRARCGSWYQQRRPCGYEGMLSFSRSLSSILLLPVLVLVLLLVPFKWLSWEGSIAWPRRSERRLRWITP